MNHAWNVVKINNKWNFIDVTLGAGYISSKTNSFKFHFNDSYFLMAPDNFFMNHYPSEETWLLIRKSKKDFANLPLLFGNYFEQKYIMAPLDSGIISSGQNPDFLFKLNGLTESDYVQYSFDSEKKSDVLEPDNLSSYRISIAGKKDNFLSIFVNGKIIAMFKIHP